MSLVPLAGRCRVAEQGASWCCSLWGSETPLVMPPQPRGSMGQRDSPVSPPRASFPLLVTSATHGGTRHHLCPHGRAGVGAEPRLPSRYPAGERGCGGSRAIFHPRSQLRAGHCFPWAFSLTFQEHHTQLARCGMVAGGCRGRRAGRAPGAAVGSVGHTHWDGLRGCDEQTRATQSWGRAGSRVSTAGFLQPALDRSQRAPWSPQHGAAQGRAQLWAKSPPVFRWGRAWSLPGPFCGMQGKRLLRLKSEAEGSACRKGPHTKGRREGKESERDKPRCISPPLF